MMVLYRPAFCWTDAPDPRGQHPFERYDLPERASLPNANWPAGNIHVFSMGEKSYQPGPARGTAGTGGGHRCAIHRGRCRGPWFTPGSKPLLPLFALRQRPNPQADAIVRLTRELRSRTPAWGGVDTESLIKVELPEANREDVKVTVQDGTLMISGALNSKTAC